MTVVKYRITGVTAPEGGGRPVALAILCTLLFLTFLDNTIVSVGLGRCRRTCTRASSPCSGLSARTR